MNKADVLRVARDCGLGATLTHNGEIGHFIEGANWTEELERFATAMYAKGAEEMRERSAKECLAVHYKRINAGGANRYNAIMDCADAIRALPITPTNTEGEQG